MKLIVLSGLPGTGKSTLADALAKELAIKVFSVDPIESSIIQSGTPRSFETGLRAYIEAEAGAAEELKQGRSVIVDAVNAADKAKQMWINLAKLYEADLKVIECICSDEAVHKQRIESRVRGIPGIPEVTWADVQARKKESTAWLRDTKVVDTSERFSKNSAELTA